MNKNLCIYISMDAHRSLMAKKASLGNRGVATIVEMAMDWFASHDDGVYISPALGEIRHYSLPVELKDRIIAHAEDRSVSASRVFETAVSGWLASGGRIEESDRRVYMKRRKESA